MKNINLWLKREVHGEFVRLKECCVGGTKCFEAEVFIGAFNYLSIEDFVEFVSNQDWDEPENLQIMIQRDHDDRFEVYEPLR